MCIRDRDRTVQLCAEPSVDRTVQLCTEPSVDRTVQLCAEPPVDRTVQQDRAVQLCAEPSVDRTLQLCPMSSSRTSLHIRQSSAVPVCADWSPSGGPTSAASAGARRGSGTPAVVCTAAATACRQTSAACTGSETGAHSRGDCACYYSDSRQPSHSASDDPAS